MTLKRIFLIVIGILLACLAGYWIYLRLAPDVTRIRWLVESMEASFNASRTRGTVKGLSEEFFEEDTRVGKEEVRQYLVYLFLKERDPETKDFLYRVELDEPSILIPAPASAELSVTARFSRRRGKGWEPIWSAAIDAVLRKDKEGWRIFRARHHTIEGKRPF